MKLKEFITSLQPDTTYLCPADIFGHSSEYLSAIEVKYRLKRLCKYWEKEGKGCEFLTLITEREHRVWNRNELRYENKDVIIIQMLVKGIKFVPLGTLD